MVRHLPARPAAAVLVSVMLAASGASAADLRGASSPYPAAPPRGVLATCEDLGGFCFAEGCGRDQIDAALACRAACPSSVVMTLKPASCPLPPAPGRPVLRRRG